MRCFKTASLCFFIALLLGIAAETTAQTVDNKALLYEQTSECGSLIAGYGMDIFAIEDFYSPYTEAGTDEKREALHSPEQRKRLVEINNQYLEKLKQADFEHMSVYGQVDYILLKKKIELALSKLKLENENYDKITTYIPFAEEIYQLEQKRRHGTFLEGEQVAVLLNSILKEVNAASAAYKKIDSLDMPLAKTGQLAVTGLQARLKSVFDFYQGYDPLFTWWVPRPYHALDTALQNYAALIISKGKLNTTQKTDKSGIKGVPVGREELIRELNAELIPYTPEELIQLANKEFAWCDKEMLKASNEMGYGNDWKKALEKVKTTYVPAGHQPELIVKLLKDADDFIKERDLITIPPLAEETWGMYMMTPQRQLVAPFFLGGKDILIAYPTNSMEQGDKMMSLRGNNPYFSRGTVQHELIPGHNLEYYTNMRYKAYRNDFQTPFAIEGWSLYWELLLYDQGFAKTPEERIGMLFWRMHRCARILFSLNYHMGKWTPQQCIDFLVDRVGHERANAEGEVRRSFTGGYPPLYQLAYLTGGLQLFALKRELVDGGKMTYKQYNDAVLKENLIPVELIRATLTHQPLTRDYTSKWKFYDFGK